MNDRLSGRYELWDFPDKFKKDFSQTNERYAAAGFVAVTWQYTTWTIKIYKHFWRTG